MSKKIAVLGAGAIGGTIASYLARHGNDITLIDQWADNVEHIKSQGLTCISVEEQFTTHPKALHLSDVSASQQIFDIVILTVKSYDTAWSLEFIKPYLSQQGFVVSAQNGMNDETIATNAGWGKLVGCIVLISAGMYKPGIAERTSKSSNHSLTIGEPNGIVSQRLIDLSQILSAVGPTKTTTNLWGERWSKLTINCMSNAVSGFTGMNSAEIRNNPETLWIRIRIAAELIEVARASGILMETIEGLPPQKILAAMKDSTVRKEVGDTMIGYSKNVGKGRPSLAQDVIKNRRTEVDYLNGYVALQGERVGIATPVNRSIVEITKRIERGELRPSVNNLKYIT